MGGLGVIGLIGGLGGGGRFRRLRGLGILMEATGGCVKSGAVEI